MKLVKATIIVFGIFSVIGLIGAIISPPSPSPRKTAAQEQKDEATWETALLMANALQKSMRNSDSFKLTSVLFMNDGSVCYEYRAQNGFGGMNVGQAVLSPKGSFRTDEMGGFRTLWNKYCANKIGEDKTWALNFSR
jgi:hypothetical protein